MGSSSGQRRAVPLVMPRIGCFILCKFSWSVLKLSPDDMRNVSYTTMLLDNKVEATWTCTDH